MPDTCLVIPVFNEEQRILSCLDTVDTFRKAEMPELECIIVDDGSKDNTLQLVKEYAVSRPWLKIIALRRNHGKGMAVRVGVEQTSSSFVFFADADFAVPPQCMLTALSVLQQGADMVIGSRRHAESIFISKQKWFRRAIGIMGNIAIRKVTGLPFLDTQCGFKGFNRICARHIFSELNTKGYLFDVEILILAVTKGFRIKEIPVPWTHVNGGAFRPFADPLKALIELWQIYRRYSPTIRTQNAYSVSKAVNRNLNSRKVD